MFDLSYDFSFHRILRTCALVTQKCKDRQIIETLVVAAHTVDGNPSPILKARLSLVSGIGAVVSRIYENGVAMHPDFLALADVLTHKVGEKSFVAALFVLAPDKIAVNRIPFSEDSVNLIAQQIVTHSHEILAKPPTDPHEISRLACAIEKGPA